MSAILRAWTSAWLGVALLVLPAWGRAATLTPANYLLDHIQQASYVAEGQGTRLLYIFFDPNCPYCHTLYENLRPWVGKDGLQVRWIPVGILTSTSEAKAAAILQAPNPLAALRKNEEDYGFSDDAGGGITPATRVGTQAGRQLAANAGLLKSQQIYGVPVLLYRDRKGRAQLLVGGPASPGELKVLLARIM